MRGGAAVIATGIGPAAFGGAALSATVFGKSRLGPWTSRGTLVGAFRKGTAGFRFADDGGVPLPAGSAVRDAGSAGLGVGAGTGVGGADAEEAGTAADSAVANGTCAALGAGVGLGESTGPVAISANGATTDAVSAAEGDGGAGATSTGGLFSRWPTSPRAWICLSASSIRLMTISRAATGRTTAGTPVCAPFPSGARRVNRPPRIRLRR